MLQGIKTIVLFSAFSLAFGATSPKLDVCEFDFFLLEHFVHPELSKIPEVLDYLVENAPQVENELCKDKSKRKGLTYKAGQLYETHREGDAAIPKVYTRYFGFEEIDADEDTTMSLAFMGGVQAMRRLPLGDMAYIVPRLQWLVKTFKFDDPIKNRKRRAFMNQFSIGISFEGRQPLSRLNVFK